jgi:predicted nucleic acid-binding protein
VNVAVVDASVAVKWVVEEEGTSSALTVLQRTSLIAPDLLLAECANILWKKVRRKELSRDEAILAARLLETASVELVPARPLLETAIRLAIEFDHPACDCLYLSLAIDKGCPFITADGSLLRKLSQTRPGTLKVEATSLEEAARILRSS